MLLLFFLFFFFFFFSFLIECCILQGCTQCGAASFGRCFCTAPYRGGFPISLTAPYIWRSGNQTTQGAMHHAGSVQCIRFKKKKNQTTANNPYKIIKQPKHSLKKQTNKQTYSLYFSNTHKKISQRNSQSFQKVQQDKAQLVTQILSIK